MKPNPQISSSAKAPSITESPKRTAQATFSRVLVPVDFSAGSRRALGVALALHRGMGSEVHLFNMAEQGGTEQFLAGTGANAPAPGELVDDSEGRMRRFVDNIFPGEAASVVVHSKVGVDFVHGVERLAREIGATLVLLGARHRETVFRTKIEKMARELSGAVMLLWVDEDGEPA